MQPNIQQLKKWIRALDSGKYQQSQGMLQAWQNTYCCLGVACKVLMPSSHLRMQDDRICGALPDDQEFAPKWLKEINMDFMDRTSNSLTGLNDHRNFSFSEIATLLELVYIHKILD